MSLGNISIVQSPNSATSSKVPAITNWNPMLGYMIYQDDISDLYYFRLVMEVKLVDGSGTLIAKIKQRRNGYGPDNDGSTQRARAFFDLRDIINTQIVDTVFDQNQIGIPFETIHKVGANSGDDSDGDAVNLKPFSVNGDSRIDKTQVQTIYIKAYQQYSDSLDAIPSEDADESITNIKTYIAASLPLFTQRSVIGGTVNSSYIQGDEFQPYQGSGSSDQFLSDVGITTDPTYGVTGYINYVQWNDTTDVGDYHTLAFLNHDDWDSEINKIWVKFFDADGGALNIDSINNTDTYGGMAPASANEDKEYLIYFGCGPGNLEGQAVSIFQNAKPSAAGNDGWAYYQVWGTNNSNVARTADYYFIREGASCKGFKIRRLAWRNSLGCYDYFNFRKKSTQTIEVNRNNYSSIIGRFNASKWYYNNTMRGKKSRQVTAVLKETLNTDWITEDQAYLLEKLIMSTDVYIVENEDTEFTEGVMITDSSIVKKTVANDKLIRYTIQIEYANPVNTNS
tara:strand:- start:3607 stop:5133 length:1527 start_codon:yes stop_codon:yes gene_type:complete